MNTNWSWSETYDIIEELPDMSWLLNSPLRSSFSSQRTQEESPPKDVDPTACYDSFRKHWQQSYDIITQSQPPNGFPTNDDVLGVVNHIDRMTTLLLIELRCTFLDTQPNISPSHSPCLEYLLSENLLGKVYEWSTLAGRYKDSVRMEQMKLYGVLVSYNGALLAHEPVARSLLRLLEDCAAEILPAELERRLVTLLNRLCVALMQNMTLLDLFFHPTDPGRNAFIIFTLLIPHIHNAGDVGQQARDAMLLCMTLSKKIDDVGNYIANISDVCPVLATGLSGLYSALPRKLEIESPDWHRLTTDDINDIPELSQFINSLEFCNAVAKIAHPAVQKVLHEYLYHGFLVPVMGPALLLQTAEDELVASTAYFDLFLRSVQEPGLLHSILRFLMEHEYDDTRVLSVLVQRILSKSRQLCIVTLAFFETLVDLNCEDVMLELCLRDLSPCSHVMISQRSRLRDVDPFGRSAERFLSLAPSCCSGSLPLESESNKTQLKTNKQPATTNETSKTASLPASVNLPSTASRVPCEGSLYGNYHAYLCDARQKIVACKLACSQWSNRYDGESTDSCEKPVLNGDPRSNMIGHLTSYQDTQFSEFSMQEVLESIQSFIDVDTSSKLDSENDNDSELNVTLSSESRRCLALSLEEEAQLDADIAELLSEPSEKIDDDAEPNSSTSTTSNLASTSSSNEKSTSTFPISDSSGYESFASKRDDDEDEDIARHFEAKLLLDSKNSSQLKKKKQFESQQVFEVKPSVGLFLDTVLRKLEEMLSNDIYVNFHLTGLISRLAIYQQPLLQSFLLNHSIVFQPSIRWLFQVLATLKQKVDLFLSKFQDVDLMIEQGRLALIRREDRLVNARKNNFDSTKSSSSQRHSLPNESFSRSESKRKSLTSSLTQMFRRSIGSSGSSITDSSSQSSLSTDQSLSFTENKFGYSWDNLTEVSAKQNVVLCAIVLDEWLKELAAITQEHVIMSLSQLKECNM